MTCPGDACTEPGCGRPQDSRGYCKRCGMRRRRYGLDMPRVYRQQLEIRYCERCGAFIKRKTGESPANYIERRFCSRACCWHEHGKAADNDFIQEHPDGATLEEIADHLGLTKERVRQIEETALLKLSAGLHKIDPSLGLVDASKILRDLAHAQAQVSAAQRAKRRAAQAVP